MTDVINEPVDIMPMPKKGDRVYQVKWPRDSRCASCKTEPVRYELWGKIFCEILPEDLAPEKLNKKDRTEWDVAAVLSFGIGEISHDAYLLRPLPEKRGWFGRNAWLKVDTVVY